MTEPMQGIVLAGGAGTRLRPSTAVVNKHLLPVYDRPMIHLPLQALRDAGVTDVTIVTGAQHVADFEAVLGDGAALGVERLRIVPQEGSGGIADALRCARGYVAAPRLMVVLGDNAFGDSLRPSAERFVQQSDGARLLLKPVPAAERSGLGVAVVQDDRVQRIVEKPGFAPPGQAAHGDRVSDLAVTGCYFYPADVFDQIEALQPSARDELEITDLNNRYLQAGRCEHDILEGWWADAGTPEGLYRAATLVREGVHRRG